MTTLIEKELRDSVSLEAISAPQWLAAIRELQCRQTNARYMSTLINTARDIYIQEQKKCS